MTTVGLIVNPQAGVFRKLGPAERMHKIAALEDILQTRATIPSSASEASAYTKDLRSRDCIVVIGGDGMLRLVASAAAGSDTILAYGGGGTGCAAQSEFHMSADLVQNAEVIRDAIKNSDRHVGSLDLLRVNDNELSMFVTLGVTCELLENYRKGLIKGTGLVGLAGYGVAGARLLPSFLFGRGIEGELQYDGCTSDFRASMIIFSKFRHLGFKLGAMPEAQHDGGKIHCRVYGKLDTLQCVPKAYLSEQKAGTYIEAAKMKLDAKKNACYELSGDVQPEVAASIKIDVVRNAVKMLYAK